MKYQPMNHHLNNYHPINHGILNNHMKDHLLMNQNQIHQHLMKNPLNNHFFSFLMLLMENMTKVHVSSAGKAHKRKLVGMKFVQILTKTSITIKF